MFATDHYTSMSWIFIRLLGAVFFIAHGALFLQIKGLISENGILPLKKHVDRLKRNLGNKAYMRCPMIFWFSTSDFFIQGSLMVSIIASVLLMLGILPPLMLLILYVVHVSITYAGQDFMSFGWELFLSEITVNAFFLSLSPTPNPLVFISLNVLLFRFHFKAGVVKLQSRDPHWKDLTAIFYHYQSQPLPNTIAWFIHKLPMWVHKLSCLYMYFVELIVPFGIFFTDEIRLFVFTQFFLLQFFIFATGNFSYLNVMTVVFSLILIPNSHASTSEANHVVLEGFLYFVGAILLSLQVIRTVDHFFPRKDFRRILNAVSPFFIANRYGIFAVMTTQRIEIVIEGSNDGKVWKEYLFKYKPSEVSRRPRRISPYQPRLDWQAWFLPFAEFEDEPWFHNFLSRMLQGKQDVLKLLRVDPFQDSPPKYIRALAYDYQFTTWKERRETGNWWKRELVGNYSPILHLA